MSSPTIHSGFPKLHSIAPFHFFSKGARQSSLVTKTTVGPTSEEHTTSALFLQSFISNSERIFSWLELQGSSSLSCGSGVSASSVTANGEDPAATEPRPDAENLNLEAFLTATMADFSEARTAGEVHQAVQSLRFRLQRAGGPMAEIEQRLAHHCEDAAQLHSQGAVLSGPLGEGGAGEGYPPGSDDAELEQARLRWLECLEVEATRVGKRADAAEAEAEDAAEAEAEDAAADGGSITRTEKDKEDEIGVGRAGFACIPILYATTRGKSASAHGVSGMFGNARADLSFGTVWVSVPDELGHLSTPSRREKSTTWAFHAHRSGVPKKSVAAVSANPLEEEDWLGAARTLARHSGDSRVLLFAHGFVTRFVNAACRIAQVAYTADFQGVTVLFSWPCEELLRHYLRAEDALLWTVPDLVHVISRVREALQPPQFCMLGHSMGSRLLTYCLAYFCPRPDEAPPFAQLVLAAPDIDLAEFFKRLPRLSRCFRSMLVYCCSVDEALSVSRSLHGGYYRLGEFRGVSSFLESKEHVEKLPGNFYVVDSTGQDDGILNHNYVFTSATVTADCSQALLGGPPSRRPWLMPRTLPSGLNYWAFRSNKVKGSMSSSSSSSSCGGGGGGSSDSFLGLAAVMLNLEEESRAGTGSEHHTGEGCAEGMPGHTPPAINKPSSPDSSPTNAPKLWHHESFKLRFSEEETVMGSGTLCVTRDDADDIDLG